MAKRRSIRKTSRKAIKRGERPVFRVEIAERTVPDMPWLEFDGNRPPAVAEAARRAIAAELEVGPEQVLVDPVGGGEPDAEPSESPVDAQGGR